MEVCFTFGVVYPECNWQSPGAMSGVFDTFTTNVAGKYIVVFSIKRYHVTKLVSKWQANFVVG